MLKCFRYILVLLWLPIAVCAVRQGKTIVVLGSSTAAGAGPKSPDSTWVSLFRDYLQDGNAQVSVINLAVGGYTSYHILPDTAAPVPQRPGPDRQHNISKALSLHPKMIIINMPSNDVTAGFSLDEYQRNLALVAELARKQGIPCYITTTQPRNTDPEKRRMLVQMRDRIIKAYPRTYINFWEGIGNEDGTIVAQYNSGDGVHLNGKAHRLLFERVKERVLKEEQRAGKGEQ